MPTAKEPEKPIESDEKVDFNDDEDPEEEEEVVYEEVEEVEEIEEEVEEEIEVEEEEEEDDTNYASGVDAQKGITANETNVEDEDEKKSHAELLARPPHGSQVYIGGIPHDASEEDLRGFCESVGEVTEVRVMKGKGSSDSKGFAFVTFRNVDLASKAIEKLSNTEFKGNKVKCSTSQAKNRLFIGNVPRSWGEEDLTEVVTEVGPGVTAVKLVKDKNSSNNRGYAFIDYYNNACAEYSRQKMGNPNFKLGSNTPNVSWGDSKNADSSSSSSSSSSAQVTVIYVKNLPENVTSDQLKRLFEHHGKITKVVLPPPKLGKEKSRIGFVHFTESSSAVRALNNNEKYELEGQILECSPAKRQLDQNSVRGSNYQLLPNYPPSVGYGLMGGAYGALGAGYSAAAFAQPLVYGSGPTPAGTGMVPMLLPDGQIGYILQQPGMQQYPPALHQRNNGRGGHGGGPRDGRSSTRGRHNYNSSHWHRYSPY